MTSSRIKVLIFAEAVTLAHVARPLALARGLDPLRFEIVFACDRRYAKFVDDQPWTTVPLHSVPSGDFIRALALGRPVYSYETLEAYVAEDLALIETHRPHLVMGDFRLSLSVSARLAKVPYIAISNAYWSPLHRAAFPMPVLPMSRWLPLGLARSLFSVFGGLGFKAHCRPLNRLRRAHGLLPLAPEIRRVYSDADHVLIADSAQMFPPVGPLDGFSYVGPLAWAPDMALPHWWSQLRVDWPVVYVTLGSSGPASALDQVIQALCGLPLQLVVSTAGHSPPDNLPDNVHVAPYLPGDQATARSTLVICNGGSLTVQQALTLGVPVLGVASNMDQFMSMAPVEEAGAGHLLRADRLSAKAILQACQQLLGSPAARLAAQRLGDQLRPARPAAEVFESVARRLLGQAGQK
jgi:UDP:flavonoid glycosyltransferase YjiC (YdhE family)